MIVFRHTILKREKIAVCGKQYLNARKSLCVPECQKLVFDRMKEDGKYNKVVLCYIEGNDAAKKLYEGFGFVEIDHDEDEIIMELIW